MEHSDFDDMFGDPMSLMSLMSLGTLGNLGPEGWSTDCITTWDVHW